MATLNQYNLNNTNGRLFFSIVENPVVEPLDGPLFIEHLMQRFPEEVYTRSRDSHLFKLLTALAGDSGAGILKKKSLLARLQFESAALGFQNLDNLYSPLIGFDRLSDEKYLINPKTSTLTQEEWDAINSADTSYRRRATQYLQAARQGGTLQGIKDAASAALGQDVQVTENYKYFFDQYSDRPVGFKKYGITDSMNEFIIRPNVSATTVTQTPFALLSILNTSADSFYFKYNGDQTSEISPGFISEEIIRSVIEGLEEVEQGDVTVKQTTTTAYQIEFANSELDIERLSIGTASTVLTDDDVVLTQSSTNDVFYSSRVGDPSFEYYNAYVAGESTSGINERSDSLEYISPFIQKNLDTLISRLKPESSLFSIAPAKEKYVSVGINSAFASSEKFYVNRFVTGSPNIAYSASDLLTGKILESGIENEERNYAFANVDFPVLFMTVDTVIAYTNQAESNPYYNTSTFYSGAEPAYKTYESQYIGVFGEPVSKIFPFLQSYSSEILYSPEKILPSRNTEARFVGSITS
jgi:hypothetical protein